MTNYGGGYYTLCYDDASDTSSNSSFSFEDGVNPLAEEVFMEKYFQSTPEALQDVMPDSSCNELPNARRKSFSEYVPPSERYKTKLFEYGERRTQSFSHYSSPSSDLPQESNDHLLNVSESCESFEFPGMTIEIDPITNTINVNTTPLSSLSGSKESLNEEMGNLKGSLADNGQWHDDDSSSGISTNSTFQSNISLDSLNMEIEKLQNIITMETEKYSQTLKRAKSCDDDLLDNKLDKCTSSVQASTVLGRKSPFRDLFRRSKVYENISDPPPVTKRKDGKPKKSLDLSHRSSSPFMFTLKRSNSLSSKDKFKIKRNSKSLTDVKKDLLSNASSDCNESTKLKQASPFVRTVFQFVELSFDDDYLGINAFDTHYENFVPVFTCNGMRHMPESSRTNSLPRRKSKCLTQAPFVRVIHQHSYQPNLISSGRRIPEEDDLILSTIAYLDRIRKAKQKPTIMARRRPRQKRNKSDPAASISKFLQDLEVPSEEDSIVNELPTFSQNTIKRSPYLPMTLDQRFTSSTEYSVTTLAEKNFSVKTSNSDPVLHSASFNNLTNEKKDRRISPFTRKTKSLRNLLSPKKKLKENTYSNESISGELRRLCNIDNDLMQHNTRFSKISSSSHTSYGSRNSMNSRSSGTDLMNFIKESETLSNTTSQKYPLSRTDCERHSSDNLLALKLLEELENSANGKKLNGNSFTKLDSPPYKNKSCLHSVSSSSSATQDDVNTENTFDVTHGSFDLIKNTQSSTAHEQSEKTAPTNTTQTEENQLFKRSKSSRKLFKGKSKSKIKRPESDDIEYWTGSFEVDELPVAKTVSPVVQKKGFTDRLRGSFRRKSVKSNRCNKEVQNDGLDAKKNTVHSPSFRKKPTDDVSKPTKERKVIEEKENKTATFSSIRSMFEPLKSPSDKSKRKASTPKKNSLQNDITLSASKQKLDESADKQMTPMHRNVDFERKRKAFTPPIKRSHNRFEHIKQTPVYFDLEENTVKTDNIKKSPNSKDENTNQEVSDEKVGDDCYTEMNKTPQKQFKPITEDVGKANKAEDDLQNENFHLIVGDLNINNDYVNASTLQRVMLMKKMSANEESESDSNTTNQHEDCSLPTNNLEISLGNVKSSIIVDVPPHLLPPDVAGKPPRVSPCMVRKMTRGLPSPSPPKKHGEQRYSENTSDGKVSDAPSYMCKYVVEAPVKYDDEAYDIINNNVTTHDHPVTFVEEDISQAGAGDSFTDDLDIDFTVDPDDNIDYSQIPNIPQPQLLQCFSQNGDATDNKIQNNEQSEPKTELSYHYSSYSSMASTLFKDLYGFDSQQAPRNSAMRPTPELNVQHASLSPKLDRFPVMKNKAKGTSVNVAMVPPFNKTESQETVDDFLLDGRTDGEQNTFGTIKRRSNTIASGEKLLQRKPSVIWARVKRMEISLIIDNDLEDPDIVKIESFDVRRVNTHKDIEELAVDTFIKHVQLLDKHVLDLRKTDILYLKLQGHEIPLGAKFDLSSTKIQDGFLPCQLCIKGKEQWSLAAMAYDTLIPKSYLEKYLSLILSNQYVVFYGSSGTGKSYLARRLAMYVTHRMNEGAVPPIILKNITPERWKFLLDNLRSEKRDFPFVVMIDGFSQTFFNAGTDICDLISLCDKLDPKPYVICTLTQVPHKGIPPLWQQDFRWIWLPNHEEPIDGILQRYLRRKFIHHGNIHLQRESFRIADWLYNTWKYINEILEKLNSTEATLGPTMFYTCPTDILTAEEWFVDLWNYSVTPYFILTAKQGLKAHGQREEWQDPLPCILKSYPWVSEKAKRKMKLRRIRMEDVGYQNKIPPACTTLDETQNEQQRLFDFLRQLETLMQDGGLGEFPIFTKTKERILESSI